MLHSILYLPTLTFIQCQNSSYRRVVGPIDDHQCCRRSSCPFTDDYRDLDLYSSEEKTVDIKRNLKEK